MTDDTPALAELEERLAANGVPGDPRAVASALLALARLKGWNAAPDDFVPWLEQLAVDLATTCRPK